MNNKPSQQNEKPASCTFPECDCWRTISGCQCQKSLTPYNAYGDLMKPYTPSPSPNSGEIRNNLEQGEKVIPDWLEKRLEDEFYQIITHSLDWETAAIECAGLAVGYFEARLRESTPAPLTDEDEGRQLQPEEVAAGDVLVFDDGTCDIVEVKKVFLEDGVWFVEWQKLYGEGSFDHGNSFLQTEFYPIILTHKHRPELSPEGEVMDAAYFKAVIEERNGAIEGYERDFYDLHARIKELEKQLAEVEGYRKWWQTQFERVAAQTKNK